MPWSAPKPCAAAGCPNLVKGRAYCDEHYREKNREHHPHRSLYSSLRWKKARKLFLAVNPNCVVCGAEAREVDHKTPHRGDLYLFWDRSNWQSLCSTCHSRKTVAEDGGFGR